MCDTLCCVYSGSGPGSPTAQRIILCSAVVANLAPGFSVGQGVQKDVLMLPLALLSKALISLQDNAAAECAAMAAAAVLNKRATGKHPGPTFSCT